MNLTETRNASESSFAPSANSKFDGDVESNLLPYQHSNKAHVKKYCRSRRVTLAVTSLVVSLFCLLVLVGCGCWVMFYYNGSFAGSAADTSDEICLPCNELSLKPPDAAGLAVRYDAENEITVCCARGTAQYAVFLKMILKKEQETRIFNDPQAITETEMTQYSKLNHSTVSAHLLLKPTDTSHMSQESAIQQWASPDSDPLSHIREGLHFHDSVIYVITPGLYFVYCQILYTGTDSVNDAKSQAVSHYVIRNSTAYPSSQGILLKSRHTRYDYDNDRNSDYVGGVFYMYSGDKLFVKVSRPSLVSSDSLGSFFGLFKVSE